VIANQHNVPIHVADIATVTQGAKIRLGQLGKAIHRSDGRIIDSGDVVAGTVLLRKGAESDATLDAIHAKVKELNDNLLPPGVRSFPFWIAATWFITRRIPCYTI
jgi:cobalt-zinc-cadmium resistance protein CzcA